MNIEKLKRANELRQEIESLSAKIDSITEINQQASPWSSVGLNLSFVNVDQRTKMTSFGVRREEMKLIINNIIECWKKQKNELETEFEQL
jgi:hypothetical protein